MALTLTDYELHFWYQTSLTSNCLFQMLSTHRKISWRGEQGTAQGLFWIVQCICRTVAQKWWAQTWAEMMRSKDLQSTYPAPWDLPAEDGNKVFFESWTEAVNYGWQQGTGHTQHCKVDGDLPMHPSTWLQTENTPWTTRDIILHWTCPPYKQGQRFLCPDPQCGLRHFTPEVAVNVTEAKQPALNFSGARGCSPG